MADFCKQCSEELFNRDSGDLAGLCNKGMIDVICEGCGPIYVDSTGRRVCEQDPREGDDEYRLRHLF